MTDKALGPSRKGHAAEFAIGGIKVAPGEQRVVDVPLASMYTHDDLHMAVHVITFF